VKREYRGKSNALIGIFFFIDRKILMDAVPVKDV
jgi:hypothetical protein